MRKGDRGMSQVYPRVCGGTGIRPRARQAAAGLSPRVRGNLHANAFFLPRPGSIPACAGEPLSDLEVLVTMEVYPRVCGGTAGNRRHVSRREGLSPRVRGNLCRISRSW